MRGMPVPVFLRAPEGNPFGVTTPRHPGDAVSTTPPTNMPPTWVEPVTGCTIKYTEKTERVFSGIPFLSGSVGQNGRRFVSGKP